MTALRGILTRSVTTLITLFGVAVIVFVVIRIAPGDPIAMMLPPGASQADIDRLRALYGLDKSIVEQFFIWLGSVLEGNFGTSISLRQNVLAIVLNRLPATLELSLLALAHRDRPRHACSPSSPRAGARRRPRPASTWRAASRFPCRTSSGGWR